MNFELCIGGAWFSSGWEGGRGGGREGTGGKGIRHEGKASGFGRHLIMFVSLY